MRERLVNKMLVMLSERFDSTELAEIKRAMVLGLDKYEVSIRSTEVAVVDPLSSAVKTYLVTRKIEGLADGTLKMYALRLNEFFMCVRKRLEDIIANDIRAFLYNVQTQRNISDRTLDGFRTIICTFFHWAASEGYIPKDPTFNIKPIKYQVKERESLNDIEVELLRDACETQRDSAIVEALYSTGCRASEFTEIRFSDIDFKEGTIKVTGKGNKTRKVYLNAKAIVAIEKYLATRTDNDDHLIVSEIRPYKGVGKRTIENRVHYLGEKAKINRNVFPHLFRHTMASTAINRGANVSEIQKMLGHSNINTTMIYAKVNDDSVKMAHARCVV